MTPPALPELMVAPNGARRGPADHPALPITVPEIVATATACHAAGADGLHAHVRDAEGKHVLDAGLYRELIQEMRIQVPGMRVQITTESLWQYSPADQRKLVEDLMPAMVSVALREMEPPAFPHRGEASFYRWAAEAGIAVQHILYDPQEVKRLGVLMRQYSFFLYPQQLLFVLGNYREDRPGVPAYLDAFLEQLSPGFCETLDWAACAFGQNETRCLVHAHRRGGKLRVGFENNFYHQDGTLADDNAARVREVRSAIQETRPNSA